MVISYYCLFMFSSHGLDFSAGKCSICPRVIWDLHRICTRWDESHFPYNYIHTSRPLLWWKTDLDQQLPLVFIEAFYRHLMATVVTAGTCVTPVSSSEVSHWFLTFLGGGKHCQATTAVPLHLIRQNMFSAIVPELGLKPDQPKMFNSTEFWNKTQKGFAAIWIYT